MLGEVARRSRDGEVGGLGGDGIFGFLMGIEAQRSTATPQALRASSPSRGAKNCCKFLGGEPRKFAENLPPLLGEVARRSRDGEVSGP